MKLRPVIKTQPVSNAYNSFGIVIGAVPSKSNSAHTFIGFVIYLCIISIWLGYDHVSLED